MRGREVWYIIKDENLYEVSENDGATFMRKGPERIEVFLCSEQEAKTAYPNELAKALKEIGQ
jgi:hypothetical protein